MSDFDLGTVAVGGYTGRPVDHLPDDSNRWANYLSTGSLAELEKQLQANGTFRHLDLVLQTGGGRLVNGKLERWPDVVNPLVVAADCREGDGAASCKIRWNSNIGRQLSAARRAAGMSEIEVDGFVNVPFNHIAYRCVYSGEKLKLAMQLSHLTPCYDNLLVEEFNLPVDSQIMVAVQELPEFNMSRHLCRNFVTMWTKPNGQLITAAEVQTFTDLSLCNHVLYGAPCFRQPPHVLPVKPIPRPLSVDTRGVRAALLTSPERAAVETAKRKSRKALTLEDLRKIVTDVARKGSDQGNGVTEKNNQPDQNLSLVPQLPAPQLQEPVETSGSAKRKLLFADDNGSDGDTENLPALQRPGKKAIVVGSDPSQLTFGQHRGTSPRTGTRTTASKGCRCPSRTRHTASTASSTSPSSGRTPSSPLADSSSSKAGSSTSQCGSWTRRSGAGRSARRSFSALLSSRTVSRPSWRSTRCCAVPRSTMDGRSPWTPCCRRRRCSASKQPSARPGRRSTWGAVLPDPEVSLNIDPKTREPEPVRWVPPKKTYIRFAEPGKVPKGPVPFGKRAEDLMVVYAPRSKTIEDRDADLLKAAVESDCTWVQGAVLARARSVQSHSTPSTTSGLRSRRRLSGSMRRARSAHPSLPRPGHAHEIGRRRALQGRFGPEHV
ncbi:hypothetical protein DFJ74DRAFT_664563 [Hyaloraphidium curvatum]|nr:hypothetical protein DFJ74DRAFT_664563 [Hyaloraphidium curvatum]